MLFLCVVVVVVVVVVVLSLSPVWHLSQSLVALYVIQCLLF